MSMWAMIGFFVVIFIVSWLIYKFTNFVMTDEQKNDDTPVTYQDENGETHFTTQADQTRQMIGKGCIWLIGVIVLFILGLIFGH